MSRPLVILFGTLLFAVFGFHSCLILVREPSHPRAELIEDDYPLETGLTWVYKSAMGLQVVRRVAPNPFLVPDGPLNERSLSSSLGTLWYEMQYDLPLLGRKTLLMRRTNKGIEAKWGEVEQLIMKFPMITGHSWTIDFPTEDLAECTVLEPEEIDVLGRRVRASKLQIVRTDRKTGKKTTDFEWYVRGIGLARMEVTFGLKANFILSRFEKAE